MSRLTPDFLRHLLHYDPLTGVWTWVNPMPRSKVRSGERAGSIDSNGRRKFRVAGEHHYSSRLAYFYMTGRWPKDQMDHINRVRDDDRWENLREATQSQNSYNRAWAEESGDLRGIRCCGKQFAVSIGAEYLGLFKTIEEAITVRDEALKRKAGQFAVITSERNVS